MTSSEPPKDRRGAQHEQREGDEPTLRGLESSDELNTGLVIVVLPPDGGEAGPSLES